MEIYDRVQEIRKWKPGDPPIAPWLTEHAAIDDGLFEQVGAEFGLRKTTCSKLYYEQKSYVENVRRKFDSDGIFLLQLLLFGEYPYMDRDAEEP